MKKLWITSDTHFGSNRTLELFKRPFKSVDEMDKVIIENWNRVVSEGDTVLHIGDFGNYEVAKSLNGTVVLVFGNNELLDYESDKGLLDKRLQDSSIRIGAIKRPYFFRYKNMTIGASHKPIDAKKMYEEGKCDFIVFGHIHKLQMVKEFGLNVSMDCHNFAPVSIDEAIFYKNAIENHYDEDVFVR